jgi:hypothetical protein
LYLILAIKPKHKSLRFTRILRPRPRRKLKTDTIIKSPKYHTFFLLSTFKQRTYFAPELSITFNTVRFCIIKLNNYF